MNQTNSYNVVGVMSGTSLDGLDIACCTFQQVDKQWNFKIVSSETISFPDDIYKKLQDAENLNGLQLSLLNNEFGNFIGNEVKSFLKRHNVKASLLSSHGHTIFHQTDKKLTLQIGNGANISAASGLNTVCNFRDLDIAYGGEGAPLVPNIEKDLFPSNNTFLNLGGIANISIHKKDSILGFDITSANMLLNHFSSEYFGLKFDRNGDIARKGEVNEETLKELSSLKYFKNAPPKSLGKEFVFEKMLPIFNKHIEKAEDKLRTAIAHLAIELDSTIQLYKIEDEILVTGGGAYNKFLIEEIKSVYPYINIPDKTIVEYKEALAFAFLGLKRYLKIPNCYKSVSGAKKDTSSGSIFLS